MTFEQFVAHINESIETHFFIEKESDIKTEMLTLAAENIRDKQILRLCRQIPPALLSPYMKTLLIVSISHNTLKDVLQWVALSKEVLLDPETADVYLFIMWEGETKPSIEECLRIEANEDFCRKFVLRPGETKELFIERTFIKKLDPPSRLDLGQDPLVAAFSVLEEKFTWFDDTEKNKWREAFSSGTSGLELFNTLINNNSENNEAS